jgi:hypothetical protein
MTKLMNVVRAKADNWWTEYPPDPGFLPYLEKLER